MGQPQAAAAACAVFASAAAWCQCHAEQASHTYYSSLPSSSTQPAHQSCEVHPFLPHPPTQALHPRLLLACWQTLRRRHSTSGGASRLACRFQTHAVTSRTC